MSRAKKKKKIFWIFLILILLVVVFYFGVLQSVFQLDKGQFSTWTIGGGCSGSDCRPSQWACAKVSSVNSATNEKLEIHPGMWTWYYYNGEMICGTGEYNTGMSPMLENLCTTKCGGANPPAICKYYYGGGVTNDARTIILKPARRLLESKSCYSGGMGCALVAAKEIQLIFTNDAFKFNISYPLTSYMVGENITIKVTIINNAMPVKVIPGLKVKTPSPLGGTFTDSLEKGMIDLPMGKTIFEYEIKVTKAIDELNVHPYISIYLKSSDLAGQYFAPKDNWNTKAFFRCSGGACHFLQGEGGAWRARPTMYYGKLFGEEVPIMITPQPLYLDIGCDEGIACPIDYFCQEETGFCLREDIKELSCYQLGCPNIPGSNYQCTSAGICAETLFAYKNCTSDINCTQWFGEIASRCDVGSGLCIEEHYYNEILQCTIASDCPKPCDGKLISCNEGTCEYEGECSFTTFGCRQLGCPEEYECNIDRNVCERTIIKIESYWQLIVGGIVLLAGIIMSTLGFIKKKLLLKIMGIILIFGSIIGYLLLG